MREFVPHPDFALGKKAYDERPDHYAGYYLHNYPRLEKDIADGKKDRLRAYKYLILNDLWFLFYFVIGTPDSVGGHKPFCVMRCNEVQTGPKSHTEDIWARGHLKSSIITIVETIQYQLGNPEHASCILSYKASVAKDKFLGSIMDIFENTDKDSSQYMLKLCFPEVLYEDPRKESRVWSKDSGIHLKRKTTRGEASIMAGGLIEGMPTGKHFERLIFDDVVTEDHEGSVPVMEDIKKKFDSAQNLKMMVGKTYQRVIGTFYDYRDPLVYIKDKVDPITGNSMYHLRLYPATHDGQPSGRAVFMEQEELDKMRGDKTFNCQQLCNPVPTEEVTLNPDYLKEIEPKDIPGGCYTFICVDQAGDAETNLTEGDDWAIVTFKVKPELSEVGASDIYIVDGASWPMGATEGVEMIANKYINAGMCRVLGIEKAGLSATHTQVREVLRKRGRFLTVENDIKKKKSNVILLLRPAGKNKKKFIDSTMEWPLNNGKIHVSTDLTNSFREKLELEMNQHPYGNDDILNTIAYLFRDIMLEYQFPTMQYDDYLPEPEPEERYV